MVKGFGMLPNKSLQGKGLCTYKDTACSAYGGTTAHCLQRLWWYHGALLAVARFSPLFHRYGVRPLLRIAIIVAALFQPGVMRGFHLFDGGAMLRGELGGSF